MVRIPSKTTLASLTEHWRITIRDFWARNTSPNKNVKIYIGAPASSTAAGSGYQDVGTLTNIAVTMRKSFPSFGGLMLWDASQAYGESSTNMLSLFNGLPELCRI